MIKYRIKKDVWKEILLLLSRIKGIHRNNEAKLKRFVEAVFYVMRTGLAWREISYQWGYWRSIHKRFKEWCKKGIFKRLFETVSTDVDLEYVMIDSTIVRAHSSAAGSLELKNQELGKSVGGFTTKIHTLVDALGNPIKFILTPGQRNDITQSYSLVEKLRNTSLLCDKAYHAQKFRNFCKKRNINIVIPPKKNHKIQLKYDKHLYKERHLIECFFGKIKQYRRIASRYDKTASVYLGFIYLAAIFKWLK